MDKQPEIDIQRELDMLQGDKPTKVTIPRTKHQVGIGWLRKNTGRKVTSLLLNSRKDDKFEDTVFAKAAAYIVLNGYFKIAFFHWFLWRWYYYIKQYDDSQLLPIIECGKKKAPQIPYFLGMAYLNGLKDTVVAMKRERADTSHQ